MAKAEQTVVLPTDEAMRARAEVAKLAQAALGVLSAELTQLAEMGVQVDEDGNTTSSISDWAKTFKIVADQIRRDNPTEHLVPRHTEPADKAKPAKPTPTLKSVKLRISG